MKTHKLETHFVGTGDVKGFDFWKEAETDMGYVYKVSSEGARHYETIKKKTVPVCISFEDRIYSETEFKEVYPKSKDFGVLGWTYKTVDQALSKLNSLS